MASGTFTGSGSYVSLKITWSSTAGTGGSTVTANLIAVNQTYYYYYATVNNGYYITINGTKKSGTTSKLSSTESGSSTLISNSVWVSYTGNKSITISGYADMSNITASGNAIGTRSVSGTATLDKVGSAPPVPTVSAPTTSTISETATNITVSWAKSSDYSGAATYTLQVSKNGGSYTTIKSGIANATVSYAYTITAGQGNTYVFRVKAVNDVGSSSYSYSGTVTTNSISAPTIGSISTYNPYVSNFSVTVSGGAQTNGESFYRNCHIYYDWGGSNATVMGGCTQVGNNTTTLTASSQSALQTNMTNIIGTKAYSNSNFYAVCWNENANGSRSSYVTKKFTVNLNSDGGAAPTLNSPTLSGGFTGYTSTCFIAGIHNLGVTSGSAATRRAPSGTTLSYKISCTGFTTVNSSANTFSKPTTGKKTVTVTVTDSRGLSTSKTVYCRFQSWAKPTITITKAERNSTTTTTVDVTYTVSYSPIYAYSAGADTAGTQLNGINSQQYSISEISTTSSTYANCTSPFSITNCTEELSYIITLRVADKVATSTYSTAKKTVGTVSVYLSARSHGIGLNCIPTTGYRLDINGNARFGDSNGYVTMSGGSLQTTSGISVAGGIVGNGGAIELFGATPYIDFHYGSSSADYTSRLIANGESKLTCTSDFAVNGSLTVGGTAVSLDGHTHSQYASSSHTHSYLPLAGGTMTGILNLTIGTTSYIGNGSYLLLGYDSTNGTRVGSTQMKTLLRSSGNNLYHYHSGNAASYLVLDSNNYSSYASPLGAQTSNSSIVQLWSGSATTASFSVSGNYKFYLVRPGTSSGTYATWIIVPYTTASNTGSFRGIGGFETDSDTYGGELYFLRGTVSSGTATIASAWARRTYNITTNSSSWQLYIKEVWGVK